MRGEAAAAALTQRADPGLGPAGRRRAGRPDRPGGAGADTRDGWRYAHWLVSHADDHGVKRVRFGGLEWTAEQGTWAKVADGRAAPTQVLAEVFADT